MLLIDKWIDWLIDPSLLYCILAKPSPDQACRGLKKMASKKINRCVSIVWGVWFAEITSIEAAFCFEPYEPQMLLAMFVHQRILCDSSPNWYTFLPSPGSPLSLTSPGLQCHCCSSSLRLCYHIPQVFHVLLMLTTLNSSFLQSTHILRLAPLLGELTSAVGCLPTTSISTFFFSSSANPTFCRSPRFHWQHHTVLCPEYQESLCYVRNATTTTTTTFSSFLFLLSKNHPLSVLLQLPSGLAPNRRFSSLYNSCRGMQPVSFSSTLNSSISFPFHGLSDSSH